MAAFTAVVALIAPGSASATVTWQPAECPRWDVNYTDPETAGQARLDAFANCKPAKLASCGYEALFHTRVDCYGVQPPPCSPTPLFQVNVPGSGLPIMTSGGIEYCAVQADGNNDKNRGNPNDCDCGASGAGAGGGGGGGNGPNGPTNMQGNPINVANGNKVQREVDFAADGEGGLSFVRVFNSMPPAVENRIGSGWTHNWARYIDILAGQAHAYRPDSRGYAFTPSGSQWIGDPDIPYTLVQLPDGSWQLTTGDNQVETYNSSGKLTSVTSPSGKLTTLVYSDGSSTAPNGELMDGSTKPLPTGKLIRVVDFRGRAMQFYYGTKGNITRVWASPDFSDT
jgi:hypothetical protein